MEQFLAYMPQCGATRTIFKDPRHFDLAGSKFHHIFNPKSPPRKQWLCAYPVLKRHFQADQVDHLKFPASCEQYWFHGRVHHAHLSNSLTFVSLPVGDIMWHNGKWTFASMWEGLRHAILQVCSDSLGKAFIQHILWIYDCNRKHLKNASITSINQNPQKRVHVHTCIYVHL